MDNYNDSYDNYSSDESKGLSIIAIVFGAIGLVTGWFLPLVSYPVTVVGLISGIYAIKRGGRVLAIVGVVMCAIGLIVSVAHGVSDAWGLLQDARYREAMKALLYGSY